MNLDNSNREKEKAIRNLNNFLHSYNLFESTELLNVLSDHFIEGVHFAAMNEGNQEQIIDFLEALEELLPTVYEMHERK